MCSGISNAYYAICEGVRGERPHRSRRRLAAWNVATLPVCDGLFGVRRLQPLQRLHLLFFLLDPAQMVRGMLKLEVTVDRHRHRSKVWIVFYIAPRNRSANRRLEHHGVHMLLELVQHHRVLPVVRLHAEGGCILYAAELTGQLPLFLDLLARMLSERPTEEHLGQGRHQSEGYQAVPGRESERKSAWARLAICGELVQLSSGSKG